MSSSSTFDSNQAFSSILFLASLIPIFYQLNRVRENQDERHLARAQAIRKRMEPPAQSQFRVVALLVFDDGSVVPGVNDEPGPYIGGSICAERSAFLRLALEDAIQKRRRRLLSVYVVTDSDKPITPGLLCREFMYGSQHTSPDMRIVMQSSTEGSTPLILSLKELYPYPTLFMKLSKHQQVSVGKSLAPKQARLLRQITVPGFDNSKIDEMILAAKEALKHDDFDELHPIRYASAALLSSSDGKLSVISASQLKGLEYGCSLDAVSQLAPLIGENSIKVLVQIDNFGIFHAPFAPARSFLAEHGHEKCTVLVNQIVGCELVIQATSATELAPYVPRIAERR